MFLQQINQSPFFQLISTDIISSCVNGSITCFGPYEGMVSEFRIHSPSDFDSLKLNLAYNCLNISE